MVNPERERPAPSLYSLRAFQLACLAAHVVPRRFARTFSPWIARAVYARLPASRNAIRANLSRITGLEGAALDALCVENVENFSRMIADYFLTVASRGKNAAHLLATWSGLEHFEAARARGKGVLLVTAHLGNWELGAILLAQHGLPLTVITLDEPTSDLTRWRDAYRDRLGIKTVAVGPGHEFAFLEMIRALQRNEVIAMLVDRPYHGTGTPVTFFGERSEFSTAPALLWQHTEAAVVPAFVLQNTEGRYVSFADPMLPLVRAADPRKSIAANTQRIATHFENIIREHPEQWFNYVPIWSRPAPPVSAALVAGETNLQGKVAH